MTEPALKLVEAPTNYETRINGHIIQGRPERTCRLCGQGVWMATLDFAIGRIAADELIGSAPCEVEQILWAV